MLLQVLSLGILLYSVGLWLVSVAPVWNPLGYTTVAVSMMTL